MCGNGTQASDTLLLRHCIEHLVRSLRIPKSKAYQRAKAAELISEKLRFQIRKPLESEKKEPHSVNGIDKSGDDFERRGRGGGIQEESSAAKRNKLGNGQIGIWLGQNLSTCLPFSSQR